MPTIALAELHDRTAEVLRLVQEEKTGYVVTQRGQPIARLLPIAPEPGDPPHLPPPDGWTRYARTAEALRQAWPANRSTQTVLDDVRRS